MKTYCVCKFCGDMTFFPQEPVKCPDYCSSHKTAAGRKKSEQEQQEIEHERSVEVQ